MIVVLSRKEAGILNYDTELLREYFKIEIRNGSDFSKSSNAIANQCKDDSDNLKFDLVIRKYRSDGTEIVPKSLQKRNRLPPPQHQAVPPPYHGAPLQPHSHVGSHLLQQANALPPGLMGN